MIAFRIPYRVERQRVNILSLERTFRVGSCDFVDRRLTPEKERSTKQHTNYHAKLI